MTLYDDCLHFISFNDKSAFALIIQDPAVVADIKSIFEAIWRLV